MYVTVFKTPGVEIQICISSIDKTDLTFSTHVYMSEDAHRSGTEVFFEITLWGSPASLSLRPRVFNNFVRLKCL